MIIGILRIELQARGGAAPQISEVALADDAVAEGVDDVEDGLVRRLEQRVHSVRVGQGVHEADEYVGASAERAPYLGGGFG